MFAFGHHQPGQILAKVTALRGVGEEAAELCHRVFNHRGKINNTWHEQPLTWPGETKAGDAFVLPKIPSSIEFALPSILADYSGILPFAKVQMYHWCMVNLTDMQWQRIRHHFPEELRPKSHPGRKPVCTRDVFEAVLWILNTGAQWHMLPPCYPNYKTVHRRFQNGCRQGVVREVLMDLAQTLHEQGGLDESEAFIDGLFSAAKGGGRRRQPHLPLCRTARRLPHAPRDRNRNRDRDRGSHS